MTLESLLVRDVEIYAPTITTDRDNNQVATYTLSTTVKGWLAQQSRSEDLDGRTAEISGWHLTVPADTTIAARYQVEIDGQRFEIDGPPNTAWTPRGAHHIEATLRVVAG